MALSCRFYYNQLPDLEDTVMVKVTKIAEMGAYVTLSEYNNKEGMILLSELSRRRIRSVNRLIRVGRSECVVVVRVDQQKEYIDLSKRRVDDSGIAKCTERYAKAKAINSILRHVAGQLGYTTNEQLEDLYEKAVWHFDRKEKKKAAAYETFKAALTDPTVFDECNLEPNVKEKLLEDIRKKLTPVAVKIHADFEVSCFAYEGVEAVKAALIEGKKQSTEQWPIKINLIAAPLFVITVQTMERDEGIEKVIALEAIKEKIESYCVIRKTMEPGFVGPIWLNGDLVGVVGFAAAVVCFWTEKALFELSYWLLVAPTGLDGSVLYCVVRSSPTTPATSTQRKFFHFTILMIAVAGLFFDAAFTRLAAHLMLQIFIILELLRSLSVYPWADILNPALIGFIDTTQESEKLIMTPLLLISGIFLPLFLSPVRPARAPLRLCHFAGVATVGIGDSFAAIADSNWGQTRLWRPFITRKSLEGSLAMFLCFFLASLMLSSFQCLPPALLSDPTTRFSTLLRRPIIAHDPGHLDSKKVFPFHNPHDSDCRPFLRSSLHALSCPSHAPNFHHSGASSILISVPMSRPSQSSPHRIHRHCSRIRKAHHDSPATIFRHLFASVSESHETCHRATTTLPFRWVRNSRHRRQFCCHRGLKLGADASWRPFIARKSLEGSLAMFLGQGAFYGVLLASGAVESGALGSLLRVLIASIVCTGIEAALPIGDNLVLPVVAWLILD